MGLGFKWLPESQERHFLKPKFLSLKIAEQLFFKFELLMGSGFQEKARKVVQLGLNIPQNSHFEFLVLLQKLEDKDNTLESQVTAMLSEQKSMSRKHLKIFRDHFNGSGNKNLEFLIIVYRIKQGRAGG